jgi:Glycosyltransferase
MVVQNLPVPFDRRVWQEALSLRRAGFSVTIICPRSKAYGKFYERLEGVHIYRYPLVIESSDSVLGYFLEFTYCWIATFFLALAAYLRCPFQAIHASNPPDTYFALALLFRPLGVKFVFDHHDLCPELYVAKGHPRQGLVYYLLLFFERLTFRTADIVISVNGSYRELARTRGLVPENKIVVVRSGPQLGWAQIRTGDIDLKRGRKFLVAFLGQIGKQDGIDYLLYAIRVYRRRYGNDTRFVIIGDGPHLRSMQHLAADLTITDAVEFLGCLSDEQLFLYLSNADLCVDPAPCNSFNDCSTMNKIVEYMSFGKPIVAFDLIEHRRSALDAAHYVRPNDVNNFAEGIHDLLENETRRQEMADFGKKRFQEALAWELTEATLVRAYQELFGCPDLGVPEPYDMTHDYARDPAVVEGKIA